LHFDFHQDWFNIYKVMGCFYNDTNSTASERNLTTLVKVNFLFKINNYCFKVQESREGKKKLSLFALFFLLLIFFFCSFSFFLSFFFSLLLSFDYHKE